MLLSSAPPASGLYWDSVELLDPGTSISLARVDLYFHPPPLLFVYCTRWTTLLGAGMYHHSIITTVRDL